MKTKIAYSQEKSIESIIADLKKQIGNFDAKLIQFYASVSINPQKISKEIYESFGHISTFGCSSAGEIISGKMLDNSIVLMAMGEDIVEDCKIEVLTGVKSDSVAAVETAFGAFGAYYHEDMSELSPKNHVGITLIDGVSGAEELINERIGDLTNITFIGGSAGDDMKFEQTYIYANGNTYTDAAVLTLIKTNTEFDIIKTQSFKSLGKQVKITKADEANRTVIEINGKPAVDEYSSIVEQNKNTIENEFAKHPVGLVFRDDFFVRSPQKISNDSIVFYCAIKEGMELDLLESQDIIEQTKKDLAKKLEQFGSVSAIINFNCILRTIELKEKKQTEDYGQIFKDIPTIGFSTYGESYIGHINQTATMLLFK